MLYTNITTSANKQVKTGAGYIQGITVVAPGTTWTLQALDGTDTNTLGNDAPILGATAMAVPAAATFIKIDCHFNKGLIIATAGATPGEIVVTWY